MRNGVIQLSEKDLLATGGTQKVFQDPTDPTRLIKVARPTKKQRLIRRFAVRRYGEMHGWHRELSETVAMLARNGGHSDRIARLFGFCDTNLGPGFVVEKIAAPDGGLAPTLAHVLRGPDLTLAYLTALRQDTVEQFQDLATARIDFHDFRTANVVVTGQTEPRLVIIDGLGSAALIPITQFSDRAFHRILDQGRQKFLAALDQAIQSTSA